MAKFILTFTLLSSIASIAFSHGVDNLVITWTTATTAAVRSGGGNHAKTYAFTHLAIYRTLTTRRAKYYKGASVQAAANYAAHYILSSLYPGLQWSLFDPAIAKELRKLTLSASQLKASQNLGKFHALSIIKARVDDGSSNYVPYTPADPVTALPGEYQFTPNQTIVVAPGGGSVKPFISSFKPKNFDTFGGPNKVTSNEYKADLAEVTSLGRMNSAKRTAYQTNTSIFYSNPMGTSGLIGQWYYITRHVISEDSTLLQTSKIYTSIALAAYHATQAFFYQKYKYNFWVPLTAVRKTDSSWTPLLMTHPHPEYPSGVATVSGAAAYALTRSINITVNTPVANFSVSSEAGIKSRYFTTVGAIVKEIEDSRVLGGVHFRKSVVDGTNLGYKVAKFVYDKFDWQI